LKVVGDDSKINGYNDFICLVHENSHMQTKRWASWGTSLTLPAWDAAQTAGGRLYCLIPLALLLADNMETDQVIHGYIRADLCLVGSRKATNSRYDIVYEQDTDAKQLFFLILVKRN